MQNKLKLCVICIKSKSSGLKNKNFKLLNGKPLFTYTLQQAILSKLFDKIIVSTDSLKALKIIENFPVDHVYIRPHKIIKAKTDKLDVILNAFEVAERYFNLKFDYIFDLDVTSPLRKVSDIKKSFIKFIQNKSNNLITATESKKNPFFNMIRFNGKKIKLLIESNKKIVARQDAPKLYDMNASIYIWNRLALKKKILFDNKTSLYLMPPERSIDIDSYFDWKLVKLLINN